MPQITMIPLEQWTGVIVIRDFVVEKCVFECKWPVELEISTVDVR